MAEELSQPENWRAVLPWGRKTPGFNLILISRIKKKKKVTCFGFGFLDVELKAKSPWG